MKKIITFTLALFIGLVMQAQTVSVTYHNNGNVKTSTYTSGSMTERVTYHKDGKLKEIARFNNGKPHGQWQEFDKNETLISEGYYVNGKKSGKWLVYSDLDNTVYQVTYKNNIKVETIEWVHGNK
jgi:antitoxin component YwqK of YwqJK toxin-antitoxin module